MTFEEEILIGFCDEASDLLLRWESVCLELSKTDTNDLYQDLFRVAHNIKGGSRAVGLMRFGDFVHHVEDGITLLREDKVKFSVKINAILLEAQKKLQQWIDGVRKDSTFLLDVSEFEGRYKSCFEEAHKARPSPSASTLTIPAAVLPTVIPQAENVLFEDNEVAPPISTPVVSAQASPQVTAAKKTVDSKASETIRINARKLDQLIQTIGEISIQQSIMWHKREQFSGNKALLSSLQLSQKLVKDLYDDALSLRMQPISNVFQKLERNILDLSKTLNKEVIVELRGADVELDKTVIERIADPLMHIVRNAIDHGIEDAVTRQTAGKAASGTIQITATKDTFGVEIHVRDDGRGLAVERILAKAKEKGLIKADAALTKDQIFQLIFLPSFSTAEKVTDVSGRGVGMDVVMQSLRDLQGSIRIDSDTGQGTSFYITLPTSVSIIDGMLIVLDGQKYVVPVTAIEEVIDLTSYLDAEREGMFNLRDQVIPVESMAKVISRPTANRVSKSDALLICRHGEQRLAFTVDAVLDQQQVVIRPLNENIDGVFGLLGGTILGDGEPSLILDVPAMAAKYINTMRPKEIAA
jgi:two-component system chemotaxis sensor kinase CheA